MGKDRLIFVVGVPSGGTSCVAGLLAHLGVDMGQVPQRPGRVRGYLTWEDTRLRREFARAAPVGALALRLGAQPAERNFRAYCETRLREAAVRGTIPGVKIGANVWLGDPHPETLPVRILRVGRPLEASIASALAYFEAERERSPEQPIERASQIAIYYQCANHLCSLIEPTLTLDFAHVLQAPQTAALRISQAFDIPHTEDELRRAAASVEPERVRF